VAIVHIGIGSNLGERRENCQKALELLKGKGVTIRKLSSFYETEPWGVTDQPSFLNAAVELETTLPPDKLLFILKDIEKTMGRVKTIQWGPRIIDLDILFYDDEIIDTDLLKIPHPLLHERDFVLAPLVEICPDKVHPVAGKTIRKLKEDLDCAKNLEHKKQKQD
jgi:2-amino-4-hydroxy-6-hydroxymethyldihydropteridine diphosphokinase